MKSAELVMRVDAGGQHGGVAGRAEEMDPGPCDCEGHSEARGGEPSLRGEDQNQGRGDIRAKVHGINEVRLRWRGFERYRVSRHGGVRFSGKRDASKVRESRKCRHNWSNLDASDSHDGDMWRLEVEAGLLGQGRSKHECTH